MIGRTIVKIATAPRNIQARLNGVLRRELSEILEAADPSASLGDRISWIEELMDWLRIPAPPEQRLKECADTRNGRAIQAARVQYCLRRMEAEPDRKAAVSRVFASVLMETDPLNLFSLLGLNRHGNFFGEALERFLRKILPAPRDENDFADLFVRIFKDERDADWIESVDSETLALLCGVLLPVPKFREALDAHYDRAIRDALTIVSSRVESLGLSPDVRLRTKIRNVQESTFWRLRALVARAQMDFKEDVARMPSAEVLRSLIERIEGCREEIRSVRGHLEEHGVSVAIVYRLQQLERLLMRIELLAPLRFAPTPSDRAALWPGSVARLIRDLYENSRLSNLFRDNFRLLTRKIIESSGDRGEHYIARTRTEYVYMLLSAAGGGVVTTGTILLKFAISAAHPALFFQGVFAWMNYAGSFLLMQGAHFTLATKQPSMTAPALAAKLRDVKSRSQLQGFVDEVAKITRSQFAAALGNIGAVIPSAILFDLIFRTAFGHHVLTPEYATKTVDSLNPIGSWTIPFAALTGVLLWLSSVCAGMLENWVRYRRIPEALAQSRLLRRVFGNEAPGQFSSWIKRNIPGIGSNVALGGFLAFTPIIGVFFGFPLDARHVTLSTGSLAFAWVAAPAGLLSMQQIALACLGILLIGLLNFGVSFAIALYVAVRTKPIKRPWLQQLSSHTWLRLRYRPLDFFLPIGFRSPR